MTNLGDAAARQVLMLGLGGELFAIDDTCTHQDASLSEGWLEDCMIECPLHAASFDLRTGRPTGPPAKRPVRTYPVLVEDGGETLLRPGDIATFGADVANGHHLVNRSDRPCRFVTIDNREGEGDCHYPDADLIWNQTDQRYTRRNGTAY